MPVSMVFPWCYYHPLHITIHGWGVGAKMHGHTPEILKGYPEYFPIAIYTPEYIGTVRAKYFVQNQNTMTKPGIESETLTLSPAHQPSGHGASHCFSLYPTI